MKAGQPDLRVLTVTSERQVENFSDKGGHLTLRNNGTNTVWISWNGRRWFDIAVGTSYECDQETCHLHYCTQMGRSLLTANWVPWM